MSGPKRVEITFEPGTCPGVDNSGIEAAKSLVYANGVFGNDTTNLNSTQATFTDKVYFKGKKWRSLPTPSNHNGLFPYIGVARTIFSYIDDTGVEHEITGTSARLYDNGVNITPLSASSTAIATSLDSDYSTLANNPITTTLSSSTITIAHTAHGLVVGDIITISGVSGNPGGITNAQINGIRTITTVVNANSYRVTAAGSASSAASGGGASVIVATKQVTVNAAAHGLSNGARVKLDAAATFAGIPDTDINKEHIIRNVSVNTFDILVVTTATSLVTAGGGGSTVFYPPMTLPSVNDSAGSTLFWSMDLFGNDLVLTAGRQTGVYIYQNNNAVAPAALSGAPTAVNWVYVSNNAVHTLGASGVPNRIKTSDVGDATNWTPGPGSLAYEDDIEGYGEFISQVKLGGNVNLLFTKNKVGSFRYVKLPDIYDFEDVMESDGLIGPRAVTQIDGIPYWQGGSDFYRHTGSSPEKLPNINCKRSIFDSYIPQGYSQLSFCQPWPPLSQIRFYFGGNDDSQPCVCMIYDYSEEHATLSRLNRTAATNPYSNTRASVAASDFSTSPPQSAVMTDGIITGIAGFSTEPEDQRKSVVMTNFSMVGEGDNCMESMVIIPDTAVFDPPDTLDIILTVFTKEYAQSADFNEFGPYTITDTTEFMDCQAAGRQRALLFAADHSTNFYNLMFGKWMEAIQLGTPV